ncbi:hypothetical protein [Caloranaerobacter ferrireducens]|uniref:hypothetical protein n=1 Tax=Caloranaerobacter ferrireducens TaxID=1323370 RepID=UPI00084D3868|nr:hypothetical protein [Caloranaerobacter ferrireducens]
MASREQLKMVAQNCSQYRPKGASMMSSTAVTDDRNKSCVNCEHFTSDNKCDINLVDEILSNLDSKLD